MSEARRQLNRMARQLSAMSRDAQSFEFWAPGPAHRNMHASNTVGPDCEVSRAGFAEFYLLLWMDWAGLLRRWQRYFGLGEEGTPAMWRRLYDRSGAVAEGILRDAELMAEIQDAWREVEPPQGAAPFETVDAAYHALLEADARMRLAARMRRGPRWGELDTLARRLAETTSATLSDSAAEVREATLRHLSHYRHATLRLSWLESESVDRSLEGRPALPRSRNMNTHWINTCLDTSELNPDTRGAARPILERIAAGIGEVGYDNFVDDAIDPDMVGGHDSPFGTDQINLIPSRHKTGCHYALLALSKGAGKRDRLGFPRIMQQVKVHLINCADATKLVIFICDTWDAAGFSSSHAEELAAHYHRFGVRYLFLMVGTPRTSIAPIAVDLGRPK